MTIICIAHTSFAQTKREIMEEDPKASPNLRLELTPFTSYSYDYSGFAGWSGRLSYRGNNKFSLSGEFRKEYFDYEDEDINNPNTLTYGKPFLGSAYELTGTYFFASKEKEVGEWLPVKQRSVGYRTIEVTVDPLPISRLALYGVRLGYGGMKGTNIFYSANIVEVGNASNKKTDERIIPLQTSGLVYFGLDATRIKNMKVKYPTYGTRRKQFVREYYLDGIYMTNTKFSTIKEDESGVVKTYQFDGTPSLKKVGARLGVFSSNTGKIVNFGYGVEIGAFPCNQMLDTYINFRLVFSLFKKVGTTEE
jgi:hypothetical protein